MQAQSRLKPHGVSAALIGKGLDLATYASWIRTGGLKTCIIMRRGSHGPCGEAVPYHHPCAICAVAILVGYVMPCSMSCRCQHL